MTNRLDGPFRLMDAVIDRLVTPTDGDHPEINGVILLGHRAESGRFVPDHVVGGHGDLNQTLHGYVGRYKFFEFCKTETQLDSFKLECQLFHEYEDEVQLDNEEHPDRPPGKAWTCPYCQHFESHS